MSQFSVTKKPTWDAVGNAYDESKYVASEGGWKYAPTGEIVVAIPNLLVKSGIGADVVSVPTFTYTGPDAGIFVTDDVLTFTLTASEPVSIVSGTPRITFTSNSVTKVAEMSVEDSTDTDLVFKYTVLDTDWDDVGIVVTPTLDKNGAVIADILSDGTMREITGDIEFTVPADVIIFNAA